MRMSLQVPQEAKGRLEESTAAGLVEVSHRLAPALQQPGLGEAQSQASVGTRRWALSFKDHSVKHAMGLSSFTEYSRSPNTSGSRGDFSQSPSLGCHAKTAGTLPSPPA